MARATWPVTALVAMLWAVAAVSATVSLVLIEPIRRLPEQTNPVVATDIAMPLAGLALASIGALVLVRGDASLYGWLLIAMGATSNGVEAAADYTLYAWLSPHDLPLTTTTGWLQDLWLVPWVGAFLLLASLFPDGSAASPRWRRAVQTACAAWLLLIVVYILADRPLSNTFLEVETPPANPTGVFPVPLVAIDVPWAVLTLASVLIGVGSMITRWRGAGTELRQQIKWVLYAFGVLLVVGAADLISQAIDEFSAGDLGLRWTMALLLAIGMMGTVTSLGMAVLRYRLYDVDLFINRTIVYAGLTVVIVLAYVAVVVGAGALLPVENVALSLLATGMVAVGAAPARAFVQRAVNRMMFGQRDDPYTLLSELGRLLARSGAPDATLARLCETVADALKLPGAAIDLAHDDGYVRRAVHGHVEGAGASGAVVPLQHQGEVVGRLVVPPRSPREPLTAQDRRLLEDVAHQAGALAHAVRLTLELQRSREGLVLAREEERRRLRRDLHDGVGPTLASQAFRLDAVVALLRDDPASAAELIDSVKQENQQLVADIRRLVHELRPPALDELGLAGALKAHADEVAGTASLAVKVEMSPDPLPPLSAAVEVAAYHIAREAITNVVRHAGAATCIVALEIRDAAVSISVEDDGTGIPADARLGVGTTSMSERAAELGGRVTVVPLSPSGTRTHATLPLEPSTTTDPESANASPTEVPRA